MRAGARRNVGARHAKRRCALQPDSLTVGVRKAQATARQGRRDRNGRSKPAVDVVVAGVIRKKENSVKTLSCRA
ncbi:hypothetical protein V5Y59_004575 [Salmonella enterica]|nr:hypothetical protein [Salmonella enterica]